MVLPRVSVIWLNYNSMRVMNLTERSLAAIAELDYPDFELVMVDNGSSDGSREVLEKLLEKGFLSGSRVKFIKLAQNLGWTGGINAGYDMRDRRARYVALTHNDLIPRPNYLKELVSFLEKHQDVGAIQGLVTRLGSGSEIDSSGFILNETLDLFPLHKSSFFSFCNPVYLSFVEGTMPVYSVDALRRVLNDDHILFITSAFMYYLEDVFVSLMLWSCGYKCVFLPVMVGEHLRGAASGNNLRSLELLRYSFRNHIALLYITNSAEKKRYILHYLRWAVLSSGTFAWRQTVLKGMIEGLRIGKQLQKKYGTINLYETPMLRTPLRDRLYL